MVFVISVGTSVLRLGIGAGVGVELGIEWHTKITNTQGVGTRGVAGL